MTSLALVAVTTGPDMIKMFGDGSPVRSSSGILPWHLPVCRWSCRVSGGRDTVQSTGTIGALTGRVVGGVLGGMIASAVQEKLPERWLKKIASKFWQ